MAIGQAFHDAVGSTAGALFGSFFGAIGGQLNRAGNPADPADLMAGMRRVSCGPCESEGSVQAKTMVNALAPAVDHA